MSPSVMAMPAHPGLHVTRLCAEEIFPVCSPKLLSGGKPLRSPADLARFTCCMSPIGKAGATGSRSLA